MNRVIKKALRNFKIEEPVSFKNLTIYPIVDETVGELKYISLDSAIKKSYLEIKEIDEGGSVPELKVLNKSHKKVFVWDGEELVGAKQNRVMNTSILINEQAELVVPVSCVEQGRWNYQSKKFKSSDYSMPNFIRRNRNKSVNETLKFTHKYNSDQYQVWKDIEDYSKKAKVKSPTSAMNDVIKSRKDEIDDFFKNLPLRQNQKGMLVSINGKLIGMDYISKKKVFKKLYKKILQSYASEAMLDYSNEEDKLTIDAVRNPDKFIEELLISKEAKYKSIGIGSDYRYDGKEINASAILYKEQLISFSAYCNAEKNNK